MSKEIITDWDAYFERRKQLRLLVWQLWYRNNVSKARSKEVANNLYSLWIHSLTISTTTQGYFGRSSSSDGKLVDTAYETTADYFERLYKSFLMTWEFVSDKPVAHFFGHSAPALVNTYGGVVC